MNAPEVRLSPDGKLVAVRLEGALWRIFESAAVNATACVSEWTPLLPVSNKDGAP